MSLKENIVIYTKDPYKSLFDEASRLHIDMNELDFNLLSFSTHYRFDNAEFKKMSEKELVFFDDDANFLKPNLELQQDYKIEIFHNPYGNLMANFVALSANQTLTKLVVRIDFRQIAYKDNLALELLKIIYKKMIKLRLFVGLRTFDFKQKLLEAVKTHKANAIKNIVQIVVAKGVEATACQDEKLLLVYKDKTKDWTMDEKRSNIISVSENELVLRHNKPKDGVNGKGLNLELIEVAKPKQSNVKFTTSGAFKLEDKENYTDYFALKKGFVANNGGNFDIAVNLDLNGADFKSVGIIKAGLENGVKVGIRLNSDVQDAVGSGVRVECEELSISGSVAGNTNLSAKSIRIDGTTQPKSKIYAKNDAFIKTHRGHFEGAKISIDLLENGFVKADEVRIKKCFGGVIEADRVYINELMNNNSCVFYQSLIIDKFEGNNNKINAKAKIKDENYEKELNELSVNLLELDRKKQALKHDILASKANVEMIEKQVLALKNEGKVVPRQYSKILQDFNILKQDYLKVQSEEKEILQKTAKQHEQIKALQEGLMEAKFINKNAKFSDMSEIKFSLLEPKKDLVYITNTKEDLREIGLKTQTIEYKEEIVLDLKFDFDEKDLAWLSQSKE